MCVLLGTKLLSWCYSPVMFIVWPGSKDFSEACNVTKHNLYIHRNLFYVFIVVHTYRSFSSALLPHMHIRPSVPNTVLPHYSMQGCILYAIVCILYYSDNTPTLQTNYNLLCHPHFTFPRPHPVPLLVTWRQPGSTTLGLWCALLSLSSVQCSPSLHSSFGSLSSPPATERCLETSNYDSVLLLYNMYVYSVVYVFICINQI